MKLFVRRQAADDRQLKMIARADQRKADLKRAALSTANESMTLRARTQPAEAQSHDCPSSPPF
jgi:hypothetical protein